MKNKFLKHASFVLGLVVALLPVTVGAQGLPTGGNNRGGQGGNRIINPIQADSVTDILIAFFRILVQVGAVAVTLAIVYAGFLFVAARGNPEELNKAKRTLMWTIIGALVLLGAQIIASVIANTVKGIGA